jgi:hypothetical protein
MTSSQYTMTCFIIWIALCEIRLTRWLSERMTCCLKWSYLDRSCPNIVLKWVHRRVYFRWQHICSILSGKCTHFASGAMQWMFIVRTWHPVQPNANRAFWSMWRMNTVANIDVWRSRDLKVYRAAISFPPQWLQDSVNNPMIHIICPAMMKNT